MRERSEKWLRPHIIQLEEIRNFILFGSDEPLPFAEGTVSEQHLLTALAWRSRTAP